MKLHLILCSIAVILLSATTQQILTAPADTPVANLKGVVVVNEPYVIDAKNGQFTGFLPELIVEIAKKVPFNYQLVAQPQSIYGIIDTKRSTINGALGEVNSGKADFALADFTITDERKNYVQFTEPFLEEPIAVLVRKTDLPTTSNIQTIDDLLEYNKQINGSDQPTKDFKFATIANGSTYHNLRKSLGEKAKSIYETIRSNGDKHLVLSNRAGADKVAQEEKLAMLVESGLGEYLAGRNCQLQLLPDGNSPVLPKIQHAIALPKNSPHLNTFNRALTELKTDGTVQRLRAKYWVNECAKTKN